VQKKTASETEAVSTNQSNNQLINNQPSTNQIIKPIKTNQNQSNNQLINQTKYIKISPSSTNNCTSGAYLYFVSGARPEGKPD
jgi:hypothetical protein